MIARSALLGTGAKCRATRTNNANWRHAGHRAKFPVQHSPSRVPRRHALAEEVVPDGPELEARAEAELRSAAGAIYGIGREEWLQLQSPARYLGNEYGAIHKPFEEARVRFALTYPEIYEVGASNLGHIILYTCLNNAEGVMCDRSYFPGPDMVEMLARHEKPLFAVESKRALKDFDTLGFSLAYELGGTNILEMLKLSGLPISRQERMEAEPEGPWDTARGSTPLVFAGGPTASSNPEAFSDFFDFFCIGDGEDALPEVARCLDECKAGGMTREETLFALATKVEGIYVPMFYDQIPGYGGAVFPNREGVPEKVRRRVSTPDPFMQVGLVPFVRTVHDRMSIEIRRGCTRGCRFCQPGMLTRPARDVDPDKVVQAVEEGIKKTGYNEFTLLSLSCSDYLSLPAVGIEIKNRLKDYNVGLSLPSQRVDRFDENISNILTSGTSKRSGLTFAPEAGTQRLRDIINKGLTNEELLRGVKNAWDEGWRQVKLYFMIGLPGETDADVLGIAETVEWLQRECRRGRQHLAVGLTISCFTPKPFTPFQWHSVSTAEFHRKQQLLREALDKLPQVKANFTPPEISAMEDFIGRSDRSVSPVIRRAWELGATNDAWWQGHEAAYECWGKAIEEKGLSWKFRAVRDGEWDVMEKQGDARYRKQGGGGKGRIDRGPLADDRLDRPLPWDHIDAGISKTWLKTDLQRALEAATVPDCSHSGLCSECGVCDEDGENFFGGNVVFEPPPIPSFEGHLRPDSNIAARYHVSFAKAGDMVFVGHLDLANVWDRACRRALLPVSVDNSPFSPRPRLAIAQPLPLGATSGGELLELNLTKEMEAEDIRERLLEQLPRGIELLGVERKPVRKLDGSPVESIPVLMRSVEYFLVIQDVDPTEGVSLFEAVDKVKVAESIVVPHKTKRGRRAKRDLRAGLAELEVVEARASPLGRFAGDIVDRVEAEGHPWVALRAKGPVEGGQVRLRADDVRRMLQEVVDEASGVSGKKAASSAKDGRRFIVAHVHRAGFEMGEPKAPKINALRIRNMLRWEGLAAIARNRDEGPWAVPLEERDLTADGEVFTKSAA